jgi:LuxR family maltose regulon positive regulatory protein
MTIPLLQTKLHTPLLRPGIVSRPRLIERLNAALLQQDGGFTHKLTLISAPAGFGKTTLLGEWITHCRRPVAWVSLDERDNDPAHFWAYFAAALRRAQVDVADVDQAMLQSSQVPPAGTILTSLLNQMAAASDSFILVLDDYHVIETPAIHEGLTFLIEHMPRQMHLVISTRIDPPLPIARLRGRAQLIELYQADLRFTSEEATDFLNQTMGLALSPEDVAALEKRTEGWIAGLQMAAISMRGHDDTAGFVRAFTGSHRYILDYLSEEVLRQQSKDVRAFLLQTAILDRLSGALCDAVRSSAVKSSTPLGNSQAILEHLERSNLFVVPLDDERRWYRYHHLFADLLRQRVQRETPDLVPDLHRRASAWYEEHGLVAEAIGHTLSAGDFERAANLIHQAGWVTFTRGEMTTILGWVASLPGDLVRSRPYIRVLNIWAMAKSGRLKDVEASLEGIDARQFQGQVAAVRAYLAGVRRDLPRAVELAHQALHHLPEEDLLLRAIVTQNLGVAYHWSGDSAAAVRTLTRAVELSRAAGQPFQALTGLAILGRAHEMQASLRQAMETYENALELSSKAGLQPVPFACMAHVGMAGPLYEWNDLDGARRHATEGIRLSELGGFVAYQLFGNVRLAQVHEAQGDRDGALDALLKAEQLSQRADYALVAALAIELRVRLWVAQGDHAAAARWIGEYRFASMGELDAAEEIEHMAVARVLIAHNDPASALRLLARLLDAAQAGERRESTIRLLVLQALAFQAQGDVDPALAALGRALSLAEPEGYVRTFLDEGEPMALLLRQALSRDIFSNYIARLLAAFNEESASSPGMDALVEPLTEREMDVLRLIVAGLSNPDIAEELFIAVSTVKSHVNHIYGKLGVENRIQAVERARTLGLV